MECYFCKQAMVSQPENTRGFSCKVCPGNVQMLTHEDKPNVTWLRFIYNDKNYQPVWYLNKDLFRIYSSNEIIFEAKSSDIGYINPGNALEKITKLLPFL